MSAAYALGRLFLRPFVVWNAFLCFGLAVSFRYLFHMTRTFGVVRRAGPREDLQSRIGELDLALVSALFPMALGTWVGSSLFELLACSFAPQVPALRRQIHTALVATGLVGAALTAWWCIEQPGTHAPLPLFAGAFLWFALGVLWADPVFAVLGSLVWLLQVLALAPLFFAPEIAAALQRHPFALGPLFLASGTAILWLPLSRRALRTRIVDPRCTRGTLFAATVLPPGSARRVAWRPGRTLASASDWARAALYEAYGNARAGLLGSVFGFTLLWSALLGAIGVVVVGSVQGRNGQEVAQYAYVMLVGRPRSFQLVVLPFTAFALPIWTAMSLAARPFTLTGAGFYPVARARRAQAAWRASLLVNVAFVVAFALVLSGASELAFRLSGLETRTPGIPEYLHVVAALSIGTPLVHAFRLRGIDGRAAQATRLFSPSTLGCLGAILGLPAVVLALEWRAGISDWSVLPWLAVVIAQFVGVQALWRHFLERHHARRDLPA